MNWRITALPLYRFVTPGSEVLFQRGFGEMMELGIHAFLLEGPATILIDTGLPDRYDDLTAAMRARKGPDAGFRPIDRPLVEILDRRGVRPDAILLSSFGPYAAGGLSSLPALPIYASARGLADLEQPEEPAFSHPLPADVRGRLSAAIPVAGEQEIFPGLTMIETGSHHAASATCIVATDEGRVAIADPIFCARNLTDGLALGAAEDARAWYAEVRRLAERVDAVIPIHDVDPAPIPRAAWHALLSDSTR